MTEGRDTSAHYVRRNMGFLEQTLTFQDPRDEILRNIKLIIRIRWILSPCIFGILALSGLLGFAGVSNFSEEQLTVNAINLGGMLLLNTIYLIIVRRIENPKPLVLFQILIDVFSFALTIYKTGGIVSPFVFLYFMVIFSGSILISGKTAFLIAGITSLIHLGIGLLERFDIIPHQAYFSPFQEIGANTTYQILSGSFAIFSFFAFASLASFLSNRLAARRRWLENANRFMRKQNDTLMFLYRTSQAITHCDTDHDLVDFILRELLSHLDLDRALLYKVTRARKLRQGRQLELIMSKERVHLDDDGIEMLEPIDDDLSTNPLIIPMREDAGLTARCALFQEAYNITSPEESPHINVELAEIIGMNPFAMAPMVLRGETLGVIGIDRMENRGIITSKEFEILKMFAAQAAIAMRGIANKHAI